MDTYLNLSIQGEIIMLYLINGIFILIAAIGLTSVIASCRNDLGNGRFVFELANDVQKRIFISSIIAIICGIAQMVLCVFFKDIVLYGAIVIIVVGAILIIWAIISGFSCSFGYLSKWQIFSDPCFITLLVCGILFAIVGVLNIVL